MTSLTVRNLPEDVKKRLRQRAAANGRSMEEEVRVLLAYLVRIDHPPQDAGTTLLDLLPKLAHNRLGPTIHSLIEPGLPVARGDGRRYRDRR